MGYRCLMCHAGGTRSLLRSLLTVQSPPWDLLEAERAPSLLLGSHQEAAWVLGSLVWPLPGRCGPWEPKPGDPVVVVAAVLAWQGFLVIVALLGITL